MSLYRVASPRARLARLLVPAAALALGLVIGLLVGRATAPTASLEDALEKPASHVETAKNALELLTIEYPQAFAAGADAGPTEYEGARATARRALDEVDRAADLRSVAPDAYERARASVADVVALVDRKAPPAEVEARSRAASGDLDSLPAG